MSLFCSFFFSVFLAQIWWWLLIRMFSNVVVVVVQDMQMLNNFFSKLIIMMMMVTANNSKNQPKSKIDNNNFRFGSIKLIITVVTRLCTINLFDLIFCVFIVYMPDIYCFVGILIFLFLFFFDDYWWWWWRQVY